MRGLHLSPEDYAYLHPFAYDDEEMPDLARSIQRAFDDPERKIELWARQFVRSDGQTLTQDLLTDITHAIRRDFVYRRRYQAGVQEPLETLRTGMGTCRDFALFMIEAVRSLGYAARFVSGYLHVRGGEHERVGGGSTHAWVQVYLPGRGLGRVRSDQRHRRQCRSDPRRDRARAATGDPALGQLYRRARRIISR